MNCNFFKKMFNPIEGGPNLSKTDRALQLEWESRAALGGYTDSFLSTFTKQVQFYLTPINLAPVSFVIGRCFHA